MELLTLRDISTTKFDIWEFPEGNSDMIPKKFLFPPIYTSLVLLSVALGLDGIMMILSLPVGLLFIGIHVVFGIQIVNIWLDIAISLLFAFLIGWAVDFVWKRFSQREVN